MQFNHVNDHCQQLEFICAQVFYFRARGISAEAARFALVKGFALEVIDSVPYSVTAALAPACPVR